MAHTCSPGPRRRSSLSTVAADRHALHDSMKLRPQKPRVHVHPRLSCETLPVLPLSAPVTGQFLMFLSRSLTVHVSTPGGRCWRTRRANGGGGRYLGIVATGHRSVHVWLLFWGLGGDSHANDVNRPYSCISREITVTLLWGGLYKCGTSNNDLDRLGTCMGGPGGEESTGTSPWRA